MLDQEDDNGHAAHEAGHVQWGKTRLSLRFLGGAVLEQQLDHLDPVLLAGDVQGREAVEGAAVGVGLAVEQQLSHAHVAAVCSHVQGGQVVYRHLGRTRDAETRGKHVSHKF